MRGGRASLRPDGAPRDRARTPTALSLPNFRYLFANNLSFLIVANGMRFAFGWYVLDGLDLGSTEQGFVIFMIGLPALFFTLVAGVWADRYDRKRLLYVSQVSKALVMVAVGVTIAADAATVTSLAVLAGLAGLASTIGSPVRSSLIPLIVRGELLFSAIALNALALTVSLVLGPVFAQAFGELFGFEASFYAMAAMLGIGIIAAVPLEVPPAPQVREHPPIRTALAEAFSYLRQHRALAKLFGLLALSSLVATPLVMVSMQAYLKTEFDRSSGDAAPLLATMGVGVAVSSLFVMRQGNMPNKGRFFMLAMTFGSAMTLGIGLTTAYWQIFPLMLLMGFASGFFITMNQGLIQANTPDALMGRVMGMFTLVMAGFSPFGALGVGLVGDAIGVGSTIVFGALLTVIVLVVVYVTDDDLKQLA